MPLALDIMKGGVSGGMAKAINGQVQPAVTAAGTTQGTATVLNASISVVTLGTGGVVLPSCEVADEVDLCNLTATAITVYPDSGSRVNGLPTNAGFQLASNTSCKLKKFTATRWLGNLSA